MFRSNGAASTSQSQYSNSSRYGNRPAQGGFRRTSAQSSSYTSGSSASGGSFSPNRSDSYNRPRFGRQPYRQSRGRGRTSYIPREKYINTAPQFSEAVSVYVSDRTFDDYEVPIQLKQNIAGRNFIHPTKIQDQVIPHVLSGKDVLGLASTGSGKTAAFLIPIIAKLYSGAGIGGKCLIITPTRELAAQIRDEISWLASGMRITSVLTIGGASLRGQIRELRENHSIVIATPGRLTDLYQRRSVRMEDFSTIVLDEVDRMLDMGFIHDIKFLISTLSQQKQSLFFSATISTQTERLANELLKEPVRIQTDQQLPAVSIEQNIVNVSPSQNKIDVLDDLLKRPEFEKVLVFSRTKHETDRLAKTLFQRGHSVDSIHGNKSQGRRMKAIMGFKRNSIKVLVATDVASRGLDVDDITHVINYDEPASYEDYIHRIGRTGRVGKKGCALTFVG
jgi:superfamily II DNA/RNA helicase